jgi:ribosomal protein S12 methylthiotransferase accessory factor YcaO
MSTLTQLYTRLILDTARDDMGSGGAREQAKIDAVADAIENYADEPFWFNRLTTTISTVANTATVAFPAGLRIPRVITYLGQALNKVPLETIDAQYNVTTPVTGLPSSWADDGSTIRFYPTPDAVYSFGLYGTSDLGVPTTANAWTVEGYRLILAEAKRLLFRDTLRDADGVRLSSDAVDEALTKLRRETRRRGVSALTTDIPVPSAFNINTG